MHKFFINLFVFLSMVPAWAGMDDLQTAKRLWQSSKIAALAQPLAEAGDSKAQEILADAYAHGWGVLKDSQKAIYWYQKSADQGNSNALHHLSFYYSSGIQVAKDERYGTLLMQKAFEIRNKLAQAGDPDALISLRYMYLNGHGVQKSELIATDLHRKALQIWDERAGRGDSEGLYKAGNEYLYSTHFKNTRKGIEYLQKASELGSVEATESLASFYRQGNTDSPKNTKMSFDLSLAAANLGSTLSMDRVALALWNGYGINKNEAKAVHWFGKSAELGSSKAQLYLGYALWDGKGVSKDERQAVNWWREAAVHESSALYLIGQAYMLGRGVEKDEKLAIDFWHKAASKFSAQASRALGIINELGIGVIKNQSTALAWYVQAAVRGDLVAQVRLSSAYYDGSLGVFNFRKSYFWGLIASAATFDDLFRIDTSESIKQDRDAKNIIRKFVKETEGQLSVMMMQSAQLAASNWRRFNPEPIFQDDRPPKVFAEPPRSLPELPSSIPVRPTKPSKPARKSLPNESVASSGSGFAVNSKYLITNAHVVEGCKKLLVNGGYPANVQALDRGNDLALLNVPKGLTAKAAIRSSPIRQGDSVTVIGFPLFGLLASGHQVTAGNVTALAGLNNDSRFIQISAPVQPGSSGGPVVDSSGNIVGVVVSKLNALKLATVTGDVAQNINFAINLSTLESFLKINKVVYEKKSSRIELKTADVAEQAKPYTALIECNK